MGCEDYSGICAICLDTIVLEELALVSGCEHAFCVTCILRWATYGQKPTCPKCKTQFSYLNVHRSVDGSLHDYMFEESVCLLLRAPWFKHLTVDQHKEVCDPYAYEEADDLYEEDLDETYLRNSSSNRIRRRAKRACRREACS
ncbi:putative RING finger protein C32D5.10 [Morella rubra]|uniref:Putative RING finger protein C32D5.10 n=1 Tax=Morella rubra TaxID=262757 RepID=A0A6A1WWA5_9ROSI|nr:putative RING finger protein C32D5.10 [Morella rubra]KAB1227977.1 putative RING finger protein C32D5.10 [Morella rubra]